MCKFQNKTNIFSQSFFKIVCKDLVQTNERILNGTSIIHTVDKLKFLGVIESNQWNLKSPRWLDQKQKLWKTSRKLGKSKKINQFLKQKRRVHPEKSMSPVWSFKARSLVICRCLLRVSICRNLVLSSFW